MIRSDECLGYEFFDYTCVISGTWHKDFFVNIEVSGSPVDFTGWAIEKHIKTRKGGATIKKYSIGSGITVTDAANGQFKVDGHNLEIKGGHYIYEFLFTNPAGEKFRWLSGNQVIIEKVI